MRQRFTTVSLTMVLLLAGCRVAVPVGFDEHARRLQPGDRVRVTRTSGERTRLVLESVGTDALVGRNAGASVRIPRAECAEVERMEIAWGRTILVAAVLGVALFGILVSNIPVIGG